MIKKSHFDSVDEFVEFFEAHGLAERLDDMPEVHFDVQIQKRHFWVTVDEKVMQKLIDRAEKERTSADYLVNHWLAERLAQAA